jgi:uncharacterized surface protein with fasciclin (FAS1) repeats
MMRRIFKYIRRSFIVWLIIIGIALSDSCNLNDKWEDYYEDAPGQSKVNVLTLIKENENFSSFYEALIGYGFEDMLTKNQYLTVFVPSNSAFDGLASYTEDEWKKIIGFHIIYTNLYSRDFKDKDLLTTIGKFLKMRSAESGGFSISGANINMGNVDLYCQNGVIHEIDRVLVPKPNVYEYIMQLDTSFSIFKNYFQSMDVKSIDFEKSIRIGVNDNGDAVYDTVWKTENYFLDNIAELNNETEEFTGFIPRNQDVTDALNSISGYFGDVSEMDEETYNQVLDISFNGCFTDNKYTADILPDTIISVTGKKVGTSDLNFLQSDLEVSNGIIHVLDGMSIPKSFFLLPITIECDRKENRRVSNTTYKIDQLSDSRATNGTYVLYGCQFVGDWLEFDVDMVLQTTYWITWTGPKQGPAFYQVFLKDDVTGEFVNIGPPVNNWTKVAWNPVVSGTYTFNKFGTKTLRFAIVKEYVPGYNSIYVDYIKLTPDEIYVP